MRINIRGLVKELLENEYLIVNYNELNDGGFDLSVRINEEMVNTFTSPHYDCDKCHKEFDVKNDAERIAMKVADEECYSDLIDCTTKKDYEKFIEKWEDQVSE